MREACVALLLLLQLSSARVIPDGEVRLASGGALVLEGQVLDPTSGQTAGGFPVALYRPKIAARQTPPEPWVIDNDSREERVADVKTSSEGRFLFRGLHPGRYLLKPSGPMVRGTQVELVLDADRPRAEVLLEVELGGRLEGRLVDEEGRVLPGLVVRIAALDQGDDGPRNWTNPPTGSRARSDSNGRFVLSQIPTATVMLQAGRHDWGYSPVVSAKVQSGQTTSGVQLTVPDERTALAAARHQIGGIGASLDFTALGAAISTVRPGLPAEQAGLEPGDLLLSLDGRDARFMSPSEILFRCRGPVGTPVELEVLSQGEIRRLTLLRGEIGQAR